MDVLNVNNSRNCYCWLPLNHTCSADFEPFTEIFVTQNVFAIFGQIICLFSGGQFDFVLGGEGGGRFGQ